MDKRLNIGLLIDDLNNYFSAQACKGAELAAKAIDANLFIFPGHYVGETDSRYVNMEYEYQYNTVFDLPSEEMVDIIYVLMGMIGSRAETALQLEFLKKLPNVPVITLFAQLEGYTSVTFDNKSGIQMAMNHLINKHSVKKACYISGPMTNKDARERLAAFKECLIESGLPCEDNQIREGDFTPASAPAIRELIEANPDIDVLVCGNDQMALASYDVLIDMGKKPGVDILVVGFDDDMFSTTMQPPLTTIEASSADLTYKAVLNAPVFINQEDPDDLEVETYLVQRSSCGCDGLDIEDMKNRLHIADLIENGSKKCVQSCEKYLFGIFADDGYVATIKKNTRDFIDAYCEMIITSEINEEVRKDVDDKYTLLLNSGVIDYVNPERFINVLSSLQNVGHISTSNSDKQALLHSMFADYYKKLSFDNLLRTNHGLSQFDSVTRLVNRQTSELFTMSSDGDISYDHLIDGFSSVGFKRSFVYLFQGNTKNDSTTTWKCPSTVLLKTYSDAKGSYALPEEQQLIRTERIFTNEFAERDERYTMTVFPLFVGEDLYGLLVLDLDSSGLGNVPTVAYQLSVTIKSLMMIEEQNRVKKELQDSLEQFMRDNSLLNKAAKSDELTGLFNRRGFLEYARKLITDPLNRGRQALVCYADMDNLKMVNDVYGHDEGDFALRFIAKVLNEAFRSSDIIGRLGGDEFVAFAIVDVSDYEDSIKTRIRNILAKDNDGIDKPYPIDMSIGVAEFLCSDEIDIFEVLEQADEKLYAEKRAKKAANGSYR